MIYAVILAAGTGTRLKSANIPKQFIKIKDATLLELVTEKFLIAPNIDKVVVVSNSVWVEQTRDLLRGRKYSDVLICEGGETRQESLYKALKYLQENFKVNHDDIIISHDVARPFITLRIIKDNIEGLKKYKVVDTVVPASDTIVQSENGTSISAIPLRKNMYQGQTPQSFYLLDYVKLYEEADRDYLNTLTDAAKLFVEKGFEVGLVRGEIFNIKITDDFDLYMAKSLLGVVEDGD